MVVPPQTLELCVSFAGITNLCTAVSCSNIFSLILFLNTLMEVPYGALER
jgi:hypothetical protein